MNHKRGRLAFGLGVAAIGWALLLVAAAFFVPAYGGETCGNGGCTSSGSTLFAENGWWVVELLGGVVLVAALAFYALHVVCSKGSERAGRLALGHRRTGGLCVRERCLGRALRNPGRAPARHLHR